jgi:hypothetical protein
MGRDPMRVALTRFWPLGAAEASMEPFLRRASSVPETFAPAALERPSAQLALRDRARGARKHSSEEPSAVMLSHQFEVTLGVARGPHLRNSTFDFVAYVPAWFP